MATKPAYYSKTKNIDAQYHFIKDMVENNKVLLEKVDTLENIIDSLTKSVSAVRFSWVCEHKFRFSYINKEDNKWENVGLLYSL
jgi:hypothetical protein